MTYRFFLGGSDLEMAEIRALLGRHAQGRVEDQSLAWGARLSAYRDALLASLAAGETPVSIELEDDLTADAFDRSRLVEIDHHGKRAGVDAATSIEQIWSLLGLPAAAWTRHHALVAANDRAHVAGMLAIGATAAEVAAIRSADRAAQGVTAADEAEAERAIARRQVDGRLTLVRTDSRTSSAIADRILEVVGGPGFDRLLVSMPDKVAVFGDGGMIEALAAAYPGSWWGGDLPKAGFWGMYRPVDDAALVMLLSAPISGQAATDVEPIHNRQ